MEKFVLPYPNSCTKCGKALEKGYEVLAENRDDVLAGKAVCLACGSDEPEPTVTHKRSKKVVVEEE